MNAKKTLQNRIRGWLPKEANASNLPTKMDFRIKFPFFVSNQLGNGNVRTIKVTGFLSSILFMVFFGINLLFPNIGFGFRALTIAFGFVFGLVSSIWVTPRILKRTENHKDSMGWKEFLGLTPAFLFLLLAIPSSAFTMFYLFSMLITFGLVRFVLFSSYEKKNKVFLVQRGWLGVVYSLVPRGSHINPNPKETKDMIMHEKIRLSSRLGYFGGFFFVLFSILQLLNKGGFFWWSGSTTVYGAIVVFSGIIGLGAGIAGSYGAFIGKKHGGIVMIVAGILGVICAPIFGVVFGGLLIVGGTVAFLESPRLAITEG